MKRQAITIPLAIAISSISANAAVTLSDNINLGVTSSASAANNVVTDYTNIDLNDGANFLAVVTMGEINVDSISFGGQPMLRSSNRDQGTYTDVNIFTLFSPNLTASQTLSVQADFALVNTGYAIQYFSFANVDSIGDTPDNGSNGGGTFTLDFGSVTAGSYLLMAGADNNGSIAFSGATTLHTVDNGSASGWDAQSVGASNLTNSASAIYSATSTQRNGIAGLELIAVPEPSAALLGGLGALLLLRRRR